MNTSCDPSRHVFWLDDLKAWGIFLVVAGHAFGAACHLTTGSAQQVMEGVFKYIYTFHMPLFFFIAGITFSARSPFLQFLRKKSYRLLLPYFSIGVFSIGVFILVADGGLEWLRSGTSTGYYQNKFGLNPQQMMLNLLLGGWYRNGFVYNSVLWFLPVLFTLELLYYPIERLNNHFLIAFIFIFAVPGGWWVRHRTGIALPWGLRLVLYYLPYFMIGRWLGFRSIFNNATKSRKLLFVVIALILSAILAVATPYLYQASFFGSCLSIICAMLCIFSWVAFWQTCEWGSGPVAVVARSAMGIMLLHKFPLLFFQNYYAPTKTFFTKSVVDVVIACLVVSLAALGISVFACMLIRLKTPWVLGEKAQPGRLQKRND